MNISQTLNGSELLLEVEGRLDTSTAPEFGKLINEIGPKVTKLIVDLGKVTYVSSAGLRVLLLAHKTMAKAEGMVVRNVIQEVMDIFTMTGFSEILNIEA